MAWPIDARYTTFTSLKEVASAFLNDVQDKMILLFEDRYMTFLNGLCRDNGAINHWFMDTNQAGGWRCQVVGALRIPIILPVDAILQSLKVKYLTSGVAGTRNFDLHSCDLNWGGGTPSSVSVASNSYSTISTWTEVSLTPTPFTIAEDSLIHVEITNPQIGDQCAGVQVKYQQHIGT